QLQSKQATATSATIGSTPRSSRRRPLKRTSGFRSTRHHCEQDLKNKKSHHRIHDQLLVHSATDAIFLAANCRCAHLAKLAGSPATPFSILSHRRRASESSSSSRYRRMGSTVLPMTSN